MKKILVLTGLLLSTVLLLTACGLAPKAEDPEIDEQAVVTPVPTAEPTPSPTPEPTPKMVVFSDGTSLPEEATVITLQSGVDANELSAKLGEFLAPEQIDVRSCSYSAAQLAAIAAACPELPLYFSITIGGVQFNADTVEVDLSSVPLSAYDDILTVLPLCTALTAVNVNNVDGLTPPDAAKLVDGGAEDASTGSTFSALGWEALGKLQQACPNVRFDYVFTYRGNTLSTAAETIDLSDVEIGTRHADEMLALAPYLSSCAYLDMEGCGIDNETMAQLNEAMPNTKVVWRVGFGNGASARTDATRIRLVKDGIRFTTSELANLKYCTDVELLDIGHNGLRNIDFVAYMPKLRVAILAIGYVEDLSPLVNCTEIEYLELFTNFISDLTPLSGLTSLRHLNLCYNDITDVSALHSLTELERVWLGRSDLTDEQMAALAEALPNTEINYGRSPTGDGWREHPRYEQLLEEFDYAHPKNGGY